MKIALCDYETTNFLIFKVNSSKITTNFIIIHLIKAHKTNREEKIGPTGMVLSFVLQQKFSYLVGKKYDIKLSHFYYFSEMF